jgi:hypothetical protein
MSIVLLGSTSGSCTLQEQAVAGSTTLTLPTFNGTVGLLVSGTAVASTSGTSIDFTSIPAGVRRITVMFQGVSTNGSSDIVVRLGSGSVQATGYNGSTMNLVNAGAVSGINYSTGFEGFSNAGAADIFNGILTFANISSNTWTCSGTLGLSSSARGNFFGGFVSLSGVLDRLRITTVNGTDTFDAGSINILYE